MVFAVVSGTGIDVERRLFDALHGQELADDFRFILVMSRRQFQVDVGQGCIVIIMGMEGLDMHVVVMDKSLKFPGLADVVLHDQVHGIALAEAPFQAGIEADEDGQDQENQRRRHTGYDEIAGTDDEADGRYGP